MKNITQKNYQVTNMTLKKRGTLWKGEGGGGGEGWVRSYDFLVFGIWPFFERYVVILIKNETIFGIPTI